MKTPVRKRVERLPGADAGRGRANKPPAAIVAAVAGRTANVAEAVRRFIVADPWRAVLIATGSGVLIGMFRDGCGRQGT